MAAYTDLAQTIDQAFDARDTINSSTQGQVREAVEDALNLMDSGKLRVAEKQADGNWAVNQWAKKAVLLSFRLNDNRLIEGAPAARTTGTRWPPSSKAGAKTVSARPDSAPCPAPSFATRPMWPRTLC